VLCLCRYGLPLETIRTGYKSGLEALLKEKPTKAIFLGTRNGDPNAVTPPESNDACLT
jgi:FAD synthetase